MESFLDNIIKSDLASGKVSKIITRFPPEPNGFLHIGHAKSICLNFGLAERYGGVCNLRFDDTNPLKEENEYVRSIIEDVKWLGFDPPIFYASDYFDVMYKCAVKLIKAGKAYIDDMTAEELRQARGTLTEGGKESKHRNRPITESLEMFEDMKNGRVADGALVLRTKIDMASPNINMRDPVIYRVLNTPHHRQGDKWCIYPMYDFAHPLEDAIEGITHSICTLEFEDHRPLYDWVLDNCWEGPRPHQYEFARLDITRTIMSKRYLKMLVDKKQVAGWDDPRMPTLAGLRRRGFSPSAIKSFCADIGVAKANSQVNSAQLEFSIRDELNMTASRAMAVLDPLELVLTNNTTEQTLSFEVNPNAEKPKKRRISFGQKIYIEREDFEVNPPPKYNRLTPDGMVRLKNAYIIKCTGYEQDKNGKVTKVIAEIIEGTKSGQDKSGIKVKGVIHWVNASDCVDIETRLYDYLLKDGEGSFEERFSDDSLIIKHGKAEKYLGKAKKAERFQFLRNGYFVRDSKENGLVFNRIVGLKDGYKK